MQKKPAALAELVEKRDAKQEQREKIEAVVQEMIDEKTIINNVAQVQLLLKNTH